jgi:hypothetical protein
LHLACAKEHKSFRPAFHPQRPDGPLTKPLAKDIHSFRHTIYWSKVKCNTRENLSACHKPTDIIWHVILQVFHRYWLSSFRQGPPCIGHGARARETQQRKAFTERGRKRNGLKAPSRKRNMLRDLSS